MFVSPCSTCRYFQYQYCDACSNYQRKKRKRKKDNNNDNWRNDPPTVRQLDFIDIIRKKSSMYLPLFIGSTKGEASDYIDMYRKFA